MNTFSRRGFSIGTSMIVAAALSASALIASSARSEDAGLAIGQPAPDFTLVDLDGNEHSLSDFADQDVVLEWLNHECPYVKRQYDAGAMQSAQAAAVEGGAVWLSIVSSAEGKQGFIAQVAEDTLTVVGNDGPVDVDRDISSASAVLLDPTGAVGHLYDARTTPHTYVIEKGVLAYRGAIDSKKAARGGPESFDGVTNYVTGALGAIAAGSEIDPAETKPYGCSVKYAS